MVNKLYGHIFKFVSQLQVSAVGWNSCNNLYTYFKYLNIYYIDG